MSFFVHYLMYFQTDLINQSSIFLFVVFGLFKHGGRRGLYSELILACSICGKSANNYRMKMNGLTEVFNYDCQKLKKKTLLFVNLMIFYLVPFFHDRQVHPTSMQQFY